MPSRHPSFAPPSWSVVRRIARERFQVEQFRPGQSRLIRAVLEGRNAVGVLPTGAGKSLCFQVPAVFAPPDAGVTVVVSPLLALMQDQTDKLEQADVPVAKLDSTLSASEERETVRDIAHGAEIVYVTPERLERPEVVDMLKKRGVALFVVDEAHCVSQWGHDFRPAYLSLRDAIAAFGRPPVLALTATATPEVTVDILKQLGIPEADAEVVRTDVERENLFFEVRRTPNEERRREALVELLREAGGSAIVYASTIRTVEEILPFLLAAGLRAERYHAKMRIADRQRVQSAFMASEVDVVVATAAFGLGIDKPDVRMVVHYNFPDSLETYYQQAGRGGRDGEPARAVLLYRLEDKRVQSYFLGGKYPRKDELQRIYDAICAAGAAKTSSAVRTIAKAVDLAERRVKVAVAQLEAMGIVERTRTGAKLVHRFEKSEELASYVTSYEGRFASDRERLDEMMHYAQTTACRVRMLSEYFGEEPREEECGHCDNCRDKPAERIAASEPSEADVVTDVVADVAPAPFHPGDAVKHRRFGRGDVIEVTEEHVRVRFARHGEKAVAPSYLKSA